MRPTNDFHLQFPVGAEDASRPNLAMCKSVTLFDIVRL